MFYRQAGTCRRGVPFSHVAPPGPARETQGHGLPCLEMLLEVSASQGSIGKVFLLQEIREHMIVSGSFV